MAGGINAAAQRKADALVNTEGNAKVIQGNGVTLKNNIFKSISRLIPALRTPQQMFRKLRLKTFTGANHAHVKHNDYRGCATGAEDGR